MTFRINSIIIILFLILFSFPSWSQDQVELPKKGFFYTSSISFAYVSEGYIVRLDNNQFLTIPLDFSRMHYGLDANMMAHYFVIRKRFSLGSGLGIVGYTPIKTVSVPFIFDIRGHLIKKDYGMYLYLRIHKAPAISESLRAAEYSNIGLGYEFFLDKIPCAAEISWRSGRTSLNNQPLNNRNRPFVDRDGVHFTVSMHLFAKRNKPE